jgi:hypothetical protein
MDTALGIGAVEEAVDGGSGQGRSLFETADVAALRRGLQKGENAGLGRQMPLLQWHYSILQSST